MWSKLQRLMRVQQVVAGITGLLGGLLLNLVSEFVSAANWPFKYALLASFFLFLGLNLWYWWRKPTAVSLRVAPPVEVRLPQEKRRVARQGLIVIVSLYTPQADNNASRLTPTERLTAAERLDYQTLDFLHSNFAPTIEAILTHASRLRHCWLIGTIGSDRNSPGSRDYIPVLVEYLRQEHQLTCQFHYGDDFELALEDDALVFSKMCQMMKEIFQQAADVKLAPSDLVTDCTSGIRSIALGAILSSLDAERDLQLIGVHYASDGRPVGMLLPMLFHFEPVIQSE